MVLKEKETLGVPVRVGGHEGMVPVQARAVDYSAYSIERLRESVIAMELDHHNFPSPYEASAYAHIAGRWERLPINTNHGPRHDFNGRLFGNFKAAVSEL